MSSDNDVRAATPAQDDAQRKEQSQAQRKRYTSSQIARIRNGARVYPLTRAGLSIKRTLSMRETQQQRAVDRRKERTRMATCVVLLVVLAFISLCPMGAAGQYYAYTVSYTTFTPFEVFNFIYLHVYQFIAQTSHMFDMHTDGWLIENASGYWAFERRAGVVGITLICAVLLSVSGMLFQNVFKNPIAGPSMLGVSSGVSIGVVILVAVYGASATVMIRERYLLCYGLGVAILLLVLAIGRFLSRKGGSLNIMAMLLVGMLLSQMLGFVISFVTLFVMETDDYLLFYNVSQQLVVDTSLISWICLGIAAVVSLVPIYLMRFKLNGLALGDIEARTMGLSLPALRIIAMVCGSIMILAAQIHTGMVGLVSLIVPFLSRSLFGCEFSKQLAGNVCLSGIFLLLCRDLCDIIPFVGDGVALGSLVGFVALPVFLVLMARQSRGWE